MTDKTLTAEELTSGMTTRVRLFCEEYVVDFNGTQAYIRAGYSAKGAATSASKLLIIPKVQAYIKYLCEQRKEENKITVDRVLLEITRLAFSDIRSLIDEKGNVKPVSEWTDDAAACIQSLEFDTKQNEDGQHYSYLKKVRTWDKVKNLELAGRYLSMFSDALKLLGPNGGPVETVTRIERVIVDPKERK